MIRIPVLISVSGVVFANGASKTGSVELPIPATSLLFGSSMVGMKILDVESYVQINDEAGTQYEFGGELVSLLARHTDPAGNTVSAPLPASLTNVSGQPTLPYIYEKGKNSYHAECHGGLIFERIAVKIPATTGNSAAIPATSKVSVWLNFVFEP